MLFHACICTCVSKEDREKEKDTLMEKHSRFVCVFALAQKAHRGLLRSVFMIPTSKVNVNPCCLQVEH